MESVAQRCEPQASPLLLLVHGRSGGLIPPELTAFAQHLERERRAPVALHALSAGMAPAALPEGARGKTLILVPLLLLPGGACPSGHPSPDACPASLLAIWPCAPSAVCGGLAVMAEGTG